MVEIFNIVIYEPLFNALMWLYNTVPGQDMGIAIILLTIGIKIILFQPSYSSIRSQRALQEIQPKLDALRAKYKDDKEKLSQELVKFYRENKVNPFSSCLPVLIQLPILFGLYRVFFAGIQPDPETGLIVQGQIGHLYSSLRAVYESTPVNTTLLGFLDLSKSGNAVLALLAGGLQFWQSKMLVSQRGPNIPGAKDENMAAQVTKSTTYIFPFITVVFAYTFPAGLALYWAASTAFTVLQQYWIFRRLNRIKVERNDPPVTLDAEGGDA